jgi:ABC-type multidrug transport system fused ATPase/permease subunit
MKNLKNTNSSNWVIIKRLLVYVKQSRILVVLTILCAITGTLMQVISPKILGNATTLIFNGATSKSGIDFSHLGRLMFIIGCLYVGVFFTTFLQERMMLVVSQRITYNLRKELKAKINKLPINYFDKHSNGNLLSIAINDLENIVNTLQSGLSSFISNIILAVGVISFMLIISWKLTLLACIMIPGSLIVVKIFTPATQKNNKEYFNLQGRLNDQIEETYQGFSVVKSFNQQDKLLKKFDETNDKMYNSGWKAKFLGGSMMPSMILVENSVYVLLAVFSGLSVVSGSILIGDMQAFLQYSKQFADPLSHFSHIWNNLLSAVASAERVFKVLDEDESTEYNVSFENKPHEEAKIAFDNVEFRYNDTPLIKDFNMSIDSGEMIAIVGHTGAGKSTLINLLERFYDIKDGNIRIDGMDIRNLSSKELRSKLGMVLQDTWLFSGTIYDNILYGNENATKEEIYAASKAAYADDFIQKLPNGYQTVLDEEASNISQGQKQLVTIARAFVSNPDILILDEATSNVDSRTELIIQKAMRKLMSGRTSFVVAHRLSTIYDADRILVMNKGDIVETGSHDTLIDLGGEYADIYNSQFSQKVM